jgi:hypothetical protein
LREKSETGHSTKILELGFFLELVFHGQIWLESRLLVSLGPSLCPNISLRYDFGVRNMCMSFLFYLLDLLMIHLALQRMQRQP